MDTQEARIYVAIIITVIVLGIIIGYFALSIIKQQRRNLELQKANALAEISAMEKERARIANDLHDDLGPLLSVVKFQIDNVELVDPDDKEQLSLASEHLDGLIERMREVANNLHPSALKRKGLIKAVEEFLNNAENSTDISMNFVYTEPLQLDENKSINIFRLIQEVVHNCIKHSRAAKLEIKLQTKNGFLEIQCRDNGIGFDYENLSKTSSGIGLRSIKNRTEIMGGNVTVESKDRLGTMFLFEIPIK